MWIWSLGWEDPLVEGMATHSNLLAWRIPWTEEPGELQSIGSQRVGHNWRDLALHLWGHTESDTTEVTQQQHARMLHCRHILYP